MNLVRARTKTLVSRVSLESLTYSVVLDGRVVCKYGAAIWCIFDHKYTFQYFPTLNSLNNTTEYEKQYQIRNKVFSTF